MPENISLQYHKVGEWRIACAPTLHLGVCPHTEAWAGHRLSHLGGVALSAVHGGVSQGDFLPGLGVRDMPSGPEGSGPAYSRPLPCLLLSCRCCWESSPSKHPSPTGSRQCPWGLGVSACSLGWRVQLQPSPCFKIPAKIFMVLKDLHLQQYFFGSERAVFFRFTIMPVT